MKVALCLSGQPRDAIKSFNLINKAIIKPNNCDVFLHLNFDKDNTYMEKAHKDNGVCNSPPNIAEKLIKIYKPKKVLIEKQKEFKNPSIDICEKRLNNFLNMNSSQSWNKEQAREHDIKCVYSMFYGIYKCNELKEMYALENNIHYDYVIRLRYDVAPRKKLICSNYDPNFIYYQDLKQPDNIISDWFNFGSNTIMNVYSSMFLHFNYINSYQYLKKEDRDQTNTVYNPSECLYGPEHMIRDLMNLFKIEKRSIDLNVTFI
jgi:hypothetical protein